MTVPSYPADLAAGLTIGQVCQKLGISENTFHRWRNQYGGMKAQEARRLKALEQENVRLKKLVADLSLDKAILKELAERPFPGTQYRFPDTSEMPASPFFISHIDLSLDNTSQPLYRTRSTTTRGKTWSHWRNNVGLTVFNRRSLRTA